MYLSKTARWGQCHLQLNSHATYSLTDLLVPTWFKELLWTVRFQLPLQSRFLAQVLVLAIRSDYYLSRAATLWPHRPTPPSLHSCQTSTVIYSGLTSCRDVNLKCAFSLSVTVAREERMWLKCETALSRFLWQRGRWLQVDEPGIGLLNCFLV